MLQTSGLSSDRMTVVCNAELCWVMTSPYFPHLCRKVHNSVKAWHLSLLHISLMVHLMPADF